MKYIPNLFIAFMWFWVLVAQWLFVGLIVFGFYLLTIYAATGSDGFWFFRVIFAFLFGGCTVFAGLVFAYCPIFCYGCAKEGMETIK